MKRYNPALKNLKVNIKFISDGDVSGALFVTDEKYKIDLFIGIGGGPEGVLAASALDAYNCKFQGRFLFKSDKDILRAKKMGISDLNKKYEVDEIVRGVINFIPPLSSLNILRIPSVEQNISSPSRKVTTSPTTLFNAIFLQAAIPRFFSLKTGIIRSGNRFT